MSRFFPRIAPSTRPRLTSIRRRRATRPGLESCEPRTLLSGSPVPVGYTPAQIRQAYDIAPITFDHGTIAGNGSGQTIAIVIEYDDPSFADSPSPGYGAGGDLETFSLRFGLPSVPSFMKYNEFGQTTNLPGPDPAGAGNPDGNAEGEEALDIEWTHAIAPMASIDVVEANSFAPADLFRAVQTAESLPGVSVVSMSWGGHTLPETSYDPIFNNSGVAFVAAAGDHGDFLYPASSPYVLGAAGTTLTLNPSGGYGGETIWNDATGTTAGGPDVYEPSKSGPDVADVAENLAVYDSYNGGSLNGWYSDNGTSAAAPQWAGLLAIADQGRQLEGLGPLGSAQTLSLIHNMPGFDFHQNITGSITNAHGTFSGPAVYGQGTPDGNLVVTGLLQEPLTVPMGNVIAPGQAVDGVVARFQDDTAPIQGPAEAWINWGDGTGSYGAITGSNGQYQVQGSHTYARAGVYPVTAQLYASGLSLGGTNQGLVHAVIAATAMDADQSWVNATCEVLLGRPADPGGLNYWVGDLESMEARGVAPSTARSQIAAAIATSPEGWSDLVNQVYQAFLNRPADPGGLSSWVSQLQGGLPVVNFLADVLSSGEFQQDHNGVVTAGGALNYITALYQVVLKRTPSAAEVSSWVYTLDISSPTAIAYDFVTSGEFVADAANTDYGSTNQYQAQAVKPAPFQAFLHVVLPRYLWVAGPSSGAASSDLANWVGTGENFWSMQFSFLASPEFYADAAYVTV